VNVSENLNQVEKQIESYVNTGDLNGPMEALLTNKLKQAIHHEEKGDDDKAVKHLEDFIKHMNNKGLQKHISEAAKEQLSADVNTIIYILS
jgi:serine-type D-Ala-D-Ala carboxypeptidase